MDQKKVQIVYQRLVDNKYVNIFRYYDDALKVIFSNNKWELLTFNENLERAKTVFCIFCQKSFRSVI